MNSGELFRGEELGGQPFVHIEIPRSVIPARDLGLEKGFVLEPGVSLNPVACYIKDRLPAGTTLKRAWEWPPTFAFRGLKRILDVDYQETIRSIRALGIDFNRLGRERVGKHKKVWFEEANVDQSLKLALPYFGSEVGLLIVSQAQGLIWPDNFEEEGNDLEDGITLKALHRGTIQIVVNPPLQHER